jgi:hypothetical protein
LKFQIIVDMTVGEKQYCYKTGDQPRFVLVFDKQFQYQIESCNQHQ